jgi:hypothetical protein
MHKLVYVVGGIILLPILMGLGAAMWQVVTHPVAVLSGHLFRKKGED